MSSLRWQSEDELGYQSYALNAANVLYRVVNDRYLKRRLIIVTTNKPLAALGQLLHDGDLAAAILDRLLERGPTTSSAATPTAPATSNRRPTPRQRPPGSPSRGGQTLEDSQHPLLRRADAEAPPSSPRPSRTPPRTHPGRSVPSAPLSPSPNPSVADTDRSRNRRYARRCRTSGPPPHGYPQSRPSRTSGCRSRPRAVAESPCCLVTRHSSNRPTPSCGPAGQESVRCLTYAGWADGHCPAHRSRVDGPRRSRTRSLFQRGLRERAWNQGSSKSTRLRSHLSGSDPCAPSEIALRGNPFC